MGADEKEKLKTFLATLFGGQVNEWQMNDKIFNLTFRLIEKSGQCTDVMHLVATTFTHWKSTHQMALKGNT